MCPVSVCGPLVGLLIFFAIVAACAFMAYRSISKSFHALLVRAAQQDHHQDISG